MFRHLTAFALAALVATPAIACNSPGIDHDMFSALRNGERNFVEPTPRDLPDIPFYDETGELRQLADYIGKPMIVTFWFPDCPNCREDLPELNKMIGQFENRDDVEILQISIRNTQEEVAEYLSGKSFTNVDTNIDSGQQLFLETCLLGTPSHVLVNSDGKIIETLFGAFKWSNEEMNTMIESFIAAS